jgi:hypothetical protein
MIIAGIVKGIRKHNDKKAAREKAGKCPNCQEEKKIEKTTVSDPGQGSNGGTMMECTCLKCGSRWRV